MGGEDQEDCSFGAVLKAKEELHYKHVSFRLDEIHQSLKVMENRIWLFAIPNVGTLLGILYMVFKGKP